MPHVPHEQPNLPPNRGGPALPDPFPDEIRFVRFLGQGAFGAVWLAEEIHLDHRRVAVKTLRGEVGKEARAESLRALQQDAHHLAKIRHRNIVAVYSWRQQGSQPYLILQYVEGGSLEDLLRREGVVSWQRAARYVADVAEGLLAVHQAGLVHRDIKLANILWDQQADEALLTDFGIATHLGQRQRGAGTIPYMAPEAFGGLAGPAQDVFSLGVSLFRLATGEFPFAHDKGSDPAEVIARGLPPSEPRLRVVPELIEQVIRNTLAYEVRRRPSLGDFLDALRGALNQSLTDAWQSSPLTAPTTAAESIPATASLSLQVLRRAQDGTYQPVSSAQPTATVLRDLVKVPPPPAQVVLHTGDVLRIETCADRDGFLTVFNIGPTGNLNLLLPDDLARPQHVIALKPVALGPIQLTPPAGRERLAAVWSAQPLRVDEFSALAWIGEVSPAYRATRDLHKIHQHLQAPGPGRIAAVVLELNHEP